MSGADGDDALNLRTVKGAASPGQTRRKKHHKGKSKAPPAHMLGEVSKSERTSSGRRHRHKDKSGGRRSSGSAVSRSGTAPTARSCSCRPHPYKAPRG